MKKLFSLLLAALMLFGITACGTSDPQETTEPAGPILGITEGNTYTNAFFGMGCTMDESWIVANEEQLAQIMGVTTDALTEANLDSSGTAYSFYAASSDGLSSVNIVMENLGLVYGTILDAKTYAETSAQQLPAAMESLGLSNVTTEVTTVTFAGQEHTAIKLSAAMSGINFYETLVCIKQGSYMAVITAASYYENTTDDILANFQPA